MGMISQISSSKWLAIGLVAGLLLVSLAAFARVKKVSPVAWGLFGAVNANQGLALGGYDAVTYREGVPAKGDERFRADWRGATWYFASDAARREFLAAPERYAPQFGGFCAFAMSKGFTANADPNVFHLADDQLYVFDSPGVRDEFLAAFADNAALSARNWAKH